MRLGTVPLSHERVSGVVWLRFFPRLSSGSLLPLLALLAVTGCSTAPYDKSSMAKSERPRNERLGNERSGNERQAASAPLQPRILKAEAQLQCVSYARRVSGLALRGDAWTWWGNAKGHYERGRSPKAGAVLVFAKTDRLRAGHVAVVTQVLSRREIVVEHANWLNQGRIHQDQLVRDVSPAGDWSQVRVWYTPGQTLGTRSYAISGFIYPPTASFKVASLGHGATPRFSAPTSPRS